MIDDTLSTEKEIATTETNSDDKQDSENTAVQIKNKPKLIISSYEIEPKMVEAGKNFDLAITFYNTNNTNTIYNLKVTLDQNLQSKPQSSNGENNALVSDGSVFTPVDSSNTFYKEAIYPWNYTTKYIKMNVLPNAKAGSYVMGVTLEYEDYLGNQYTTNESIGIPVVQKAQITSGAINIEEGLSTGVPTPVSMNIYNTGKDNLSTFMLKVEGEGFTVDEDTKFIGNFASGSTENYSFNITPTDQGKVEGKIIISYEDSTGKEHKEEKKFSKEVTAASDGQMLDENGNPIETDPKTGEIIGKDSSSGMMSSVITNPIAWIGLILAIILVILFVKRRRNKKKAEELIIDED